VSSCAVQLVQFSMEQIPVRSVCVCVCVCVLGVGRMCAPVHMHRNLEESLTNQNPLSSNIICLQVRQQHEKGPVTCNEPAGWFCLVTTQANIAWILAHVDTIQEVQHIIIHRPYTCPTGAYSTPCSHVNYHPYKIQLQRHQSPGQRCVFTILSVFGSDSW
jgi:hypothetical protein